MKDIYKYLENPDLLEFKVFSVNSAKNKLRAHLIYDGENQYLEVGIYVDYLNIDNKDYVRQCFLNEVKVNIDYLDEIY